MDSLEVFVLSYLCTIIAPVIAVLFGAPIYFIIISLWMVVASILCWFIAYLVEVNKRS